MKIIHSSQLPYIAASHEDPKHPGSLKKVLFVAKDFSPEGMIQMINWAKISPGKAFRSHYHEDMDEIFLIIAGNASLRLGDEEAVLVSGDAVHIPAGSVHTMKNDGEEAVEYIVVGVSKGVGGKTVLV